MRAGCRRVLPTISNHAATAQDCGSSGDADVIAGSRITSHLRAFLIYIIAVYLLVVMLTGTDPLGRRDGRSGMPPYLNRPRAQTRRHLVGFVVQRGCVIGSKGSDQKHRNTCRHSRAQSVLIKEGTPQPPRTTPSTPRHWWMVQSFLDIYELQGQGKTRNGSVMLEREDCGSTSPPKKQRTHTHTHSHTTAHTHTQHTHNIRPTLSSSPGPRKQR